MPIFDWNTICSPEVERVTPLPSTLPDEPPVTLEQDIAKQLRDHAGNAFNADTCRAGANEIERLRLARQAMETQWHRAEVELDKLRRELETVRSIAARAIARNTKS